MCAKIAIYQVFLIAITLIYIHTSIYHCIYDICTHACMDSGSLAHPPSIPMARDLIEVTVVVLVEALVKVFFETRQELGILECWW